MSYSFFLQLKLRTLFLRILFFPFQFAYIVLHFIKNLIFFSKKKSLLILFYPGFTFSDSTIDYATTISYIYRAHLLLFTKYTHVHFVDVQYTKTLYDNVVDEYTPLVDRDFDMMSFIWLFKNYMTKNNMFHDNLLVNLFDSLNKKIFKRVEEIIKLDKNTEIIVLTESLGHLAFLNSYNFPNNYDELTILKKKYSSDQIKKINDKFNKLIGDKIKKIDVLTSPLFFFFDLNVTKNIPEFSNNEITNYYYDTSDFFYQIKNLDKYFKNLNVIELVLLPKFISNMISGNVVHYLIAYNPVTYLKIIFG